MTPSEAPSPVDLLIRHGYVITVDDNDTVIEDGAVAVLGNRIVEVGADADLAARYTPARTIDAGGAPVHPGLVDTHAHTSYHLYRGILPDSIEEGDVFDEFTQKYVDGVTDDEERLAVQLAAIEMIRNGTTCFAEAGSVFEPEAAATAANAVGIRAVIADPFIMDTPGGYSQGADDAPTRASVPRAPQNLDQAIDMTGRQLWRNDDPEALVTGHIALRGLGTASTALIVHAKQLADRHGAILNMHQSYSPADHAADREKFGVDPVLGLEELGVLDERLLLGHANYLTDDEVAALVRSRAGVAWAPVASMMWGHSSALHTRHAEVWRGGGSVGLGSDSGNWSNAFDVFRQANVGVLVSRASHGKRSILTSSDAMRMATAGGAQAIGLADRIGSLESGKRADIVIHTLERPELMPRGDLVRNLVYSSGSKSVSTVIVDGRVVLDRGEFATLDERAALRELDAAALAMFSRVGYTVTRDSGTHGG